MEVVAFVDDLRLSNTGQSRFSETDDKIVLTNKLMEFKENCEYLGVSVHEKHGKLIWPTQSISWIGWIIDSISMFVNLADDKAEKGARIVAQLRSKFQMGQPVSAKEAMSVWGFLNFIAAVIKQAQPCTRELGRCIVEAQVFQAWSSGHKRFNPPIKASPLALEDLSWWLDVFQSKPRRQIHHLCNRSFLWHHRLPNLQEVRSQAWDHGILVILGLDAYSTIGWGFTMGDVYHQGHWTIDICHKHNNWKELKTHEIALDTLGQQLANKIIYVFILIRVEVGSKNCRR